jgi:tRNA(adenine34) deaminase
MLLTAFSDEYFMKKALEQALQAQAEGEVPIGAVVVSRNTIIGKGYNQVEKLNDVTSHAEMIALTAASVYLSSKYLDDCTLYVTLEPCMMCAAAVNLSHISRVVYGASDPKRGYRIFHPSPFDKKMKVSKGILEEECSNLLLDFFHTKR